jgi:hypothetical protein
MPFIAAAPMPPEVQRRMARLLPPGMLPPNLFPAVARNQGLVGQLVDSGLLGPTGLLDGRRLLREAIMLRTCVATGNRYEWRLHVGTISARMGLTSAQIDDAALIEITQLADLYAGVAMMVALVDPALDPCSAPLPTNKV